MSKIKKLNQLKNIVAQLKRKNKKIVFTNGCFDLLHSGHIKVFNLAKAKGDILIVGLNSDASIKKIKGSKRPIIDQESRAQLLEAIGVIDYVVLFNETTPQKTISALKPDYLVKGGDWSKDSIVGSNLVKKTYRIKLEKGKSSSQIIKKILAAYK